MSQLEQQIKQEFESGVSQIIVRIFTSCFGWIFDGFDKLKYFLHNVHLKRKARKERAGIFLRGIIQNFCRNNEMDLLIIDTHNGKKSAAGHSYKHIKPVFSFVRSENELLNVFVKDSSDYDSFVSWLNFCLQGKNFEKSEYHNRIDTFFKDYNRIAFRHANDVYYIALLHNDKQLTKSDET